MNKLHIKASRCSQLNSQKLPSLRSLVQDFFRFLKDDAALLRAGDARWLLVPSQTQSLFHSKAVNGVGPHAADGDEEPEGTTHLSKGTHLHGLRIALPEEAIEIGEKLLVGSGVDAHVTLSSPEARIWLYDFCPIYCAFEEFLDILSMLDSLCKAASLWGSLCRIFKSSMWQPEFPQIDIKPMTVSLHTELTLLHRFRILSFRDLQLLMPVCLCG